MGLQFDDRYEPPVSNPDQLEDVEYLSENHPSLEMLLLRTAIDKALMVKQRELWELYAYEKLNTEEIAKKLHTTRQNIAQRLKVVEKKLTEYCAKHRPGYLALKEAENDNTTGC